MTPKHPRFRDENDAAPGSEEDSEEQPQNGDFNNDQVQDEDPFLEKEPEQMSTEEDEA